MESKIKLARMNPEKIADEIGDFILGRVLQLKKTGAIIGLSGGVDSTTTAALAQRAFAKHKEDNLELVGYILHSKTNSPKDQEDGVKVAERLGIRYEVQNIEPIVVAYYSTNPETLSSKFHKGNLMSEIRATVLHAKSATENKTLLGTGNRDEDFGIGYYTLFGDGAVHISPIGNLPKRLVREMAVFLGFEDLAYRVPTAGLEPGQTDFKDLGYEYELVEIVSDGLMQGFSLEEIVIDKAVNFIAQDGIKKYETIFGKKKFDKTEDAVKDIIRRNEFVAKPKATLVHPDVPKLSLEYD